MQPASTSFDALFLSFQTTVAGRYSIDRELGRGGMGVVYLAREVHLDRLVAIKLLPPELSKRQELRDRFLREARLAAKLSHPNIIPIHAVEQAGEFVYYVMAYVDGETLAQRVQSRGPLSPSDAIRQLREVAWALAYAHGQGLVHRDVKPDNILLETASGRALVADFGIAVVQGDAGAGVAGTPEFMSPEQALGGDIDARSDLYSLGATAYFALTGRLPFAGATATEVLAHQVTSPPPSISLAGAGIPRRLAQLVDRCLAKDPSVRPESAQRLAELFGDALEQRRELPAALRAFARRNGRMNGGGTMLGLAGSLVGSIATSAVAGAAAGVAVLAAGLATIPVVFGIVAAKRLLDTGFTQQDLAPAFRAELDASREERGVSRRVRFSLRSAIERVLRTTAEVAATMALILLPFVLTAIGAPRFAAVWLLMLCALGVTAFAGVGYVVLLQLRRDVDVEFWNAAWTGRFGTIAFAAAKRLRGAKPIGHATTHRATELSLGMAAEQLFESLPAASRDALGDVPRLVDRLQRDAHALRQRLTALQDALADGTSSAGSTSHIDAVREEQQQVHERLGETVGALERVRLGLLRLHAGSLTLEGLTTHIHAAGELSDDLSRLAAANDEVEAVLRFPQQPALTPA